MALTPGTRFGNYEITGSLGKGGMGEVYRARDVQLGRDVAIKTLPAGLATDADRLARFTREAQLLASLNHAHIASIHSLDEHEGTRYLAMELVEGETLEDRIKNGPLPVETALELALQIAQALEAAHDKGVVHRDLKPANVMVTPGGVVKVLDFGLAKAFSTEPDSAPEHSPALSLAMTQAGLILGTAGYMSPEQASGQAADQRADIWAFGVVLYEMLTGQPVFSGESVPHILADVLKSEPDWRRLPQNLHPRLRLLLERCLRKKPRDRYHSIADARVDIEDILKDPGGLTVPAARDVAGVIGGAPPASASIARRAISAVVLVAFGAVAAGLLAWNLNPGREDRSPPVVQIRDQFENLSLPLSPTARDLALSRDGRFFVFRDVGLAASTEGGLYVRTLADAVPRLIPGTDSRYMAPELSPDAESIAFWVDGQIRRMPLTGGVSVPLASAKAPYGIDWTDDGSILYADNDGIFRVPENGGEVETLVTSGDGFVLPESPQQLPNGDWILYIALHDTGGTIETSELVVESPSTGERRVLRSGVTDARYLPTGYIIYGSSGVLYATTFDANRLEMTGGAVPVVQGVRAGTIGVHQFDVSDAGHLIYVPGQPISAVAGSLEIVIADPGGTETPVTTTLASYELARASPDGQRLALETQNSGEDAIIWIQALDGQSSMQRLTFAGNNRFPVWSPDSEAIAFQSDRDGDVAIYRQRIDGTGGAIRLTMPGEGETHIPESWSPDGRILLFAVERRGVQTLWTYSFEDETVARFSDFESTEPIGSMFSPDGAWVAYHALPPGAAATGPNSGVYVEPFPATGARYQAPKVYRDFQPIWSPDGTTLNYIGSTSAGKIASVRVTAGNGLVFGSPTSPEFRLTAGRLSGAARSFDVLPDGRYIGPTLSGDSEFGNDAARHEVRTVLNWVQTLKEIAPAR